MNVNITSAVMGYKEGGPGFVPYSLSPRMLAMTPDLAHRRQRNQDSRRYAAFRQSATCRLAGRDGLRGRPLPSGVVICTPCRASATSG